MKYIFNSAHVKAMVEHWLSTPPNGYIGVTYGRNLKELLFYPMNQDRADTLLSWLREDIPVLKNLSDSDLTVASEKISIDKKIFYIKIGEILIHIPDNQGGFKNDNY